MSLFLPIDLKHKIYHKMMPLFSQLIIDSVINQSVDKDIIWRQFFSVQIEITVNF